MKVRVHKETAREIMTKQVATINSLETVHDALTLMAENHLSALPVVDRHDSVTGMISQSDIIGIAHDADEEDLSFSRSLATIMTGGIPLEDITTQRIEEIMSDTIVPGFADDSLTVLAEKMLAYGVHHLPIVNEDNRLLGIVSTMDVLKALTQPTEL